MLTPEQLKWLGHLDDVKKIIIKPYDKNCPKKFEQLKNKIHKNLGNDMTVEHHGASYFKISGQDEIDVYVPVPEKQFYQSIKNFEKLFSKPRSIYPLKRARFATEIAGKHIDVFVINRDSDDWINLNKFEQYLLTHSKELKKYKELKEKYVGHSVKQYYQKKLEFINYILNAVNNRKQP